MCQPTLLSQKIFSNKHQYNVDYIAIITNQKGKHQCQHDTILFSTTERHCSYLLQEPEGPIFSPGWPDVYPRNARCFWKVRLQLGSNVRLQVNITMQLPLATIDTYE